VYALDAINGDEKWSFEAAQSTSVRSSPTVIDNTVYIGSGSTFYALNATDGSEQWSEDIAIESSPAVANGAIYLGSTEI